MKNNIFCIRIMKDGRFHRTNSHVFWKPFDGWKRLRVILDIKRNISPQAIRFGASSIAKRSLV